MPSASKRPRRSEIESLVKAARSLAKRYRVVTGRPLGITGEIAEFEAVRLLRLTLSPARQPGFDAIRTEGGRTIRYQVKGRVVFRDSKPGQMVGAIKLEHPWDRVLLVLLDEDLIPTEIFEARRAAVRAALAISGSAARARGARRVSWFKRHGTLVWSRRGNKAAA
jgi:hypothetical protein